MELDMSTADFTTFSLPSNLDIGGQDLKKRTVDIVGSMEYYELLKERGYPVRLLEVQPQALDPRYLQPDEIVAMIGQLKEQFPDLVHVEEIGRSLKNRPIYAVRITSPDNIEAKPSISFNGMHHAREIMTTEVTTDIMTYLASNYQNAEKPWVQTWLDSLQVWVIPQVNPDGNDIVWNEDTWWRKNARGSGGSTWGVDINRNYPYAWGTCGGSSGSKSSQTYRGESGGSEPETQALMKFIKDKNVAMNVSYHSYSELVIAPYGCKGVFTPEDFIVKSIGAEFAKTLKRDSAIAQFGLVNAKDTYDYGTGWELLYPVDGDDISWMYAEVNTMSYVVEVNSTSQGFQPSYDKWRDRTVGAQRLGWAYMLNRMIGGAQVRGRLFDASTNQAIEGEVVIRGVKYKTEKPRRSLKGYFQKMMVPGSYELTFTAPGYQPQTISVSLDNAPVQQDIYMEKASNLGLDELSNF